MADVPNLALQAANMYAQNPADKESYLQYYTDFYTKQVQQVRVTVKMMEKVLQQNVFPGPKLFGTVLLSVRGSFRRFDCAKCD